MAVERFPNGLWADRTPQPNQLQTFHKRLGVCYTLRWADVVD